MRSERGAVPAGTVFTVFGARGGIGKTTIATNLAATLASASRRSVLVIDMDTSLGDVALMMGVRPTKTIVDLAEAAGALNRATFQRALLEHPSGAFVLGAPEDPRAWRRVTAEQIQAVVRFAARQFDYVILDTAGIFNDVVASAIEVADRVIVVNGLDTTSTRQTAQMFDLLDAARFPPDRHRLVLNQVNRALAITPADVEAIVGHDVYWTIPYDEQVPASQAGGRPLVMSDPGSHAAQQLRGLGAKLAAEFEVRQRSILRRLIARLQPPFGSRATAISVLPRSDAPDTPKRRRAS